MEGEFLTDHCTPSKSRWKVSTSAASEIDMLRMAVEVGPSRMRVRRALQSMNPCGNMVERCRLSVMMCAVGYLEAVGNTHSRYDKDSRQIVGKGEESYINSHLPFRHVCP